MDSIDEETEVEKCGTPPRIVIVQDVVDDQRESESREETRIEKVTTTHLEQDKVECSQEKEDRESKEAQIPISEATKVVDTTGKETENSKDEHEISKEVGEKQEGQQGKAEERSTSNSVKSRAEALLLTGGMPLFPPGLRQWEEGWQVVLSLKPTSLYWPPKDWKELSPEERLTAWRFVSFSLERERGLNISTKERDVLDKYAMLALPGTAVPNTIDKFRITNTRASNHNLTRKIYLGEIEDEKAEEWLKMFERAVGLPENEDLLKRLENISLRKEEKES